MEQNQHQTSTFVTLEERHIEQKVAALACYKTQTFRHYANAEFIRSLAVTRDAQIGVPLAGALAWGKTSFQTHLFRYDSGVDSGAIVGAQRFDITVWDDCETLHFKNTRAMNRLLRECLPEILAGNDVYKPQPTDIEPTYLPKRTPEHGRIRWSD